ncbi:hypothetical protein TNCV_395741 [Trichonephila clavipes]|nr:hypothetical protein TNCV_395741 [Trichonephila clavipes]
MILLKRCYADKCHSEMMQYFIRQLNLTNQREKRNDILPVLYSPNNSKRSSGKIPCCVRRDSRRCPQNNCDRSSPVAKVMDSWAACYEFRPSTAEDPPCNRVMLLLLPRLKHPPDGVVWKLVDLILTSHCSATRGLLATDHVILNHGQVTWTTPELAPPLPTNTPTEGRFSSRQI